MATKDFTLDAAHCTVFKPGCRDTTVVIDGYYGGFFPPSMQKNNDAAHAFRENA